VDVNISRIRTGVETPSDYTYIHSIRGVGYRFEPIPKETSNQTLWKNGAFEGALANSPVSFALLR
jgi:hypothetical protein